MGQLGVLAEAFGMEVSFYDIVPKMAIGTARAAGSLQEILKNSDFVSLHTPYTEQTNQMINRDAVQMMKKGSYLLNAARGKCVDVNAVAEGLKSGHLAGAFFDVFPAEPIEETLVLRHLKNVIMSPHIGGSTQEAQDNIGVDVANKLCRFINGGCTVGSVNFPNVDMPISAEKRHRIIQIYKNVPGVLAKISNQLSSYDVRGQVLS